MNNNERISTRLTPLVQGTTALLSMSIAAWAFWLVRSGPDPVWSRVVGAAVPLIVASVLSWLLLRASCVVVNESSILVRRFGSTVSVEFRKIQDVRSWNALALGIITLPIVRLVVSFPDGTKKRVYFIARFTLKGWVKRTHPDVLMLKRRAGLT